MQHSEAVKAALLEHYGRVWNHVFLLQDRGADDWRVPLSQSHIAAKYAAELLRDSLPELLGETQPPDVEVTDEP